MAARKLLLTTHVIASVGWLGAVAAFLALAIAGLADSRAAPAAYVGTGLVTSYVIVPLCFASLVTGCVQALVTPWGLTRHYWVVVKLVITALATAILMLHLQPIARLATAPTRRLQIQVVVDAALAIVALVIATVLSTYKPRGRLR